MYLVTPPPPPTPQHTHDISKLHRNISPVGFGSSFTTCPSMKTTYPATLVPFDVPKVVIVTGSQVTNKVPSLGPDST